MVFLIFFFGIFLKGGKGQKGVCKNKIPLQTPYFCFPSYCGNFEEKGGLHLY